MHCEKEACEWAATKGMIAHKHELQRLTLQNDLDLTKHVLEMERLNEEGWIINIKDQNSYSVAKTPKIPAFDENRDEMDSYLLRFERYATAQRWKRDQWATNLSALL